MPGIVDDDGELVSVKPVGAPQHEVADRRVDDLLLWSLDSVLEGERARRGAETLRACAPSERESAAAGAGVDGSFGSGVPGSGNLGTGAAAGIGHALSRETVERVSVGVGSSALIDHVLVPFEPERAQGAEDQVGRPRDLAWAVDVFDPHQPDAPVGAGVRVAGHSGEE